MTRKADGLKQVFFRNLIGAIEDAEHWKSWLPIQTLLICSMYDNFNVLFSGPGHRMATYALYSTVRGVAEILRLKGWYPEYTPEELRSVAASRGYWGSTK